MVQGAHITVIGVGGGGCRVVDRLSDFPVDGVMLAAVDTDLKSLSLCRATLKVQIGQRLTNGLGTGGDANLARQAASDDIDQLRSLCVGTDLVFVVTGLGGGTGTGAGPLVLNTARAAGAMTLCFATLPFDFEGRNRGEVARQAVNNLRDAADAVILVPNDRLFESVGESAVADSFHKADDVISMGVRSVWRLITQPGFINLSLSDLHKVVRRSGGVCTFAYGRGTGPQRTERAVMSLLQNPLLEKGDVIARARALLVSLVGGDDLTLKEIDDVMKMISKQTRPDADISMGTVIDPADSGAISITLLTSESLLEPEPGPVEPPVSAEETEPEGGEKDRTSRFRKRKELQTKLKFDASGQSRFKDTEPTVLDGEDLDTPTYIRRGILIEK
jgi:cell division protein FtsZ